ncbi:MAG: HAD family hydrolase [Pyrinomonadaceae bacterium]
MDPRTRHIKTLLFDWDGTIADSAQLGLTAFQKSFAVLGFEFPQETYEATYSPNWYSIYEAMGLPKEKWEKADELWMQHYGEQTAQLVDGAESTIRQLRRNGYRMGIVSSGSNARLTRELRHLGLSDAFEVIICNEHMQNKKPHPEGLETALGLLKSPREQSCYVGDSPEDIEMGKSAHMLTVGLRSTYPTSWKLRSANPDIYLESFAELTAHFRGSASGTDFSL